MTAVTFHEALELLNVVRFQQYARLFTTWPGPTAVDLVEPRVDDHGAITLARWGGYDLQICAMITNERLVMTPQRHPAGGPGDGSYTHGWCYPRGLAAGYALLVWDPAVQAEPGGYARRATVRVRPAGEKAAR